jgi:hypothetical protein
MERIKVKKTFRSEADVKTAVKQLLAEYPGVWYFMPASNGYGRAGVPDFVGCFQDRFFAIETKFGSNKPTPAQKMELKKIHDALGVAMIINEKNLETLHEILDDMQLGLYPHAKGFARATLKEYGVEV